MEVSKLLQQLSIPTHVGASDDAAKRFLDLPDPSENLDRAYMFLVWQGTVRIVLEQLRRAGADLDEFVISPDRYRRTFFSYKPVWNLDIEPPITASKLLDVILRQRDLLTASVLHLADAGVEDFALLSGRALQARYPAYNDRGEFDTDLITPQLAAAGPIADALADVGFELDTVRVRRLGSHPDSIVEIRSNQHGHRLSVGVVVGGYFGYRGPILERSTKEALAGRRLSTPSPEDLLVMLSARVERKRKFALVNVNDAAAVVRHSGADFDWDYVFNAARRFDLADTLAIVLERAVDQPGVELPQQWRSGLVDHDIRTLRLGRLIATDDLTFGLSRSRSARRRRRLWLLALRRKQFKREDQTLAARGIGRVQERLLRNQLRHLHAGGAPRRWDPAASRMRTRVGTFCEIAPSMAATEGCLAPGGISHQRGPAAGLLDDVATTFRSSRSTHNCDQFRFSFTTRKGI